MYAMVGVEYFTKWIEVKPIANIASTMLNKFLWQNIICQFGVLRDITVDNAKQFNCDLFKDFCYQMSIEAAFTSVYHPQSNGAVEQANALIFRQSRNARKTKGKENGQRNYGRWFGATTPPFLGQPIHAIQAIVW
jgi:hypothetical protein